jgi:hypothetical protein
MRPTVTLTAAMADGELFGGTFGATSFWTWRVVAKLIDGELLTEPREIELFKQCTGRSQLPNRQARRRLRRVIVLCGRRGGKDRFLSAVAIWRAALCADWRKHISAGEQAVVLLLGADRRQAGILRRYAEGLLAAPLLAREVSRRTDDFVEFRNGSSLEIATNNSSLVRGRSAIAVLGSECCHWRTDEAAASSDEEVVGAAEPSMAMCPDGGLLMLGSSVHRRRGYMYRQFKRLHGNDDGDDVCWFAPSRVMNPKLSESVVEEAMANDAPKARAEFLNVWREDVDDFVPADIVEACTDFGVVERPRQPGVTYVAYADAAGGTGQDSFTLAVGHAEADAARSVVIDLVRERKPRFVAADVIAEFARILHSYGIAEVVADGFAGGFCSDEWVRNGVRFRACENNTSENYMRALPLLTSKRARLSDFATLRVQLSGLERRVVGGHEVVSHARAASAHDDVACAVCGCLAEAAANTPADWRGVAEMVRQYGLAARRGMGPSAFQVGERRLAQMQRDRERRWS